ncbi:MAG TPA: ABC transporter ATP-binding protein [Candidatus Latescibacteria bacterium]|jgi:oligopeptide/dipeptide ABC transporter ATP-binding protein|nr:ABC transporter ATP-binding protein [Candidatus Latescibacterota bacterium]HJN27034.1 ABC transporter ATP-binding protein [Candidatus Latescibacterota bacterium]
MSDAPRDIALEIEDLKVEFDTLEGVVSVLKGVDLAVHRGEAVGLVGESGSGKSVTAMSVLRLLREPPARLSGSIKLHGSQGGESTDLAKLDPGSERMQQIRGNDIAMVFQEPMSSLSPVFTVGHQVAEVIWLHQDKSRPQAYTEAEEILERVGIPEPARAARQYPHNLSGGQLQRVMIAMALACQPMLVIADEPTTALDVTIQAQIMDLLQELRETLNLAVLLITHDLAVVAGFCERVNVMYMGRVVEEGSVMDIFQRPTHPYTQGLLNSIPRPGQQHKERFPAIRGTVPDPRHVPPGCAFGPRCDHFEANLCDRPGPVEAVNLNDGHQARCYRTDTSRPYGG